jgi:hypothetical protein
MKSMNEKENMVHVYTPQNVYGTCTHHRILAIKKNEIMSFTGKWIELEIIMSTEISQAQKAKYSMISFVKPRLKMMIVNGT